MLNDEALHGTSHPPACGSEGTQPLRPPDQPVMSLAGPAWRAHHEDSFLGGPGSSSPLFPHLLNAGGGGGGGDGVGVGVLDFLLPSPPTHKQKRGVNFLLVCVYVHTCLCVCVLVYVCVYVCVCAF
jgi:hypothetical protein